MLPSYLLCLVPAAAAAEEPQYTFALSRRPTWRRMSSNEAGSCSARPHAYGASPDDGLKLADKSQATDPLSEARRRVPLREIAQDVLHLQDASQTRHPRVMDMEHAQDALHQLGARAARVDQAGVAAPRPSAQRAQRPVEAVAVGRPPAPRPRELLRRVPGPPEIWEARL